MRMQVWLKITRDKYKVRTGRLAQAGGTAPSPLLSSGAQPALAHVWYYTSEHNLTQV